MSVTDRHIIVTAGPTYEPLDQVRRLTNHSTGRLGSNLASDLERRGYPVTLALGSSATHQPHPQPRNLIRFTTTQSLAEQLEELSRTPCRALFHAAAVSDFQFGQISPQTPSGEPVPLNRGKWSTRSGKLIAELLPTKKIIRELRNLYPETLIAGWKYEIDGDRQSALALAEAQISVNRTDLCVANGPAYGEGFGLVSRDYPPQHLPTMDDLFAALAHCVQAHKHNP